ncbi:MAG: NAD(P)/FAD-dependent oxidoreductase [Lachnospiraceae bacterium]|nr:NAD(P)/FAD-dependent oxidoreductase [Lachnospiraceae bacterium]
MSRVIVVGGGAAGMFAACTAALYGHEVTVIEKNEKTGKKLFITGKGRCNMTNAAPVGELMDHVITNPRFLHSAFAGFNNRDFLLFCEEHHLPYKIERGERVFPESDHSSDVLKMFSNAMEELGVTVLLHTKVTKLLVRDGMVAGVEAEQNGRKDKMKADAVILATGGLSYPVTGSDGDGFKFAKELGHHVEKLRPALVPLTCKEADLCRELMGLSLKNVTLKIFDSDSLITQGFGEMLFTHFGISGPIVLTASSVITGKAFPMRAEIDLKPALSEEQLHTRFLREFSSSPNKAIHNVIGALYPSKLVPVILRISGVSPEKKVNEVTQEERKSLVHVTKHFPLTVTGTRGFEEAIITHGGIDTREVNPKTMESRLVTGLFFAGEILDVDAETGGFNLQIAWSTAFAAASHIEYC